MADYVSILAKAIGGLAENNADNRQLIYQKARGAIDRKLRAMEPLPSEEVIAEQLSQLETAINQVEGEYQLAAAEAQAASAAAAMESASAKQVEEPTAPTVPPVEEAAPAETAEFSIPVPNPPEGFFDDVILIDGIGEKIRLLLAEQGITGVSQIAAMSDAALALVAEKIGFPDFEKNQQWKQQAADMLAGELPRSKTDQERLKKLQEGEAAVSPVADGAAKPDSQLEISPEAIQDPPQEPKLETQPSIQPETPPVAPLPVEPQTVRPELPDIGEPAFTQTVSTASSAEPSMQAGEQIGDTQTLSDDERAIAAAIRALSSGSENESSDGPQVSAPAGERLAPENDPFLEIPAPQAPPSARREVPQIEQPAPPPYVSELEGDPMAAETSGSYTPPESVDLGNRKRGAGKAIGCVAALAILAGLGYGAWANQDIVKTYLNKAVMAAQELFAGGSAGSSAENGASGQNAQESSQPDASGEEVADSTKDTSRLGSGGDAADQGGAPAEDGNSAGADQGDTVSQTNSDSAGDDSGEPQSILDNPLDANSQDATVEVEGGTNEENTTGEQVVEENAAGEDATGESVAPAILNGEKAFLYEEAIGATGASRDEGGIIWSLAQEAPEDGAPAEAVIKGVMEVPGRGLTMNIAIKRNVDPGLPASHLIELFFTAQSEFSGGNIDNVSRFVMKATEEARGESLVGVPARIDTGYFLIALNNLDQAQQTNLQLLANADWIDVPVAYVTGRRALMTFEKGESGRKVFADALADWKNR
jgi:predicted flap endonuclease-1-like 5' DNA nuclease